MMIDEKTKIAVNEVGETLSKILLDFYGKIVFNFQNGNYVNANVEQSIRNENLKERDRK